jgi:hypothetical protein
VALKSSQHQPPPMLFMRIVAGTLAPPVATDGTLVAHSLALGSLEMFGHWTWALYGRSTTLATTQTMNARQLLAMR